MRSTGQGRGSALHREINPQAKRQPCLCQQPTIPRCTTHSAPCLSFPSCKIGVSILILLCEAFLNDNHLQVLPAQRPQGPEAGTNTFGFGFKQHN